METLSNKTLAEFRMSNLARNLIRWGYKGNGCGSSKLSHKLCQRSMQAFKIDLRLAWLIHDAEFDTPFKNISHWARSNYNIMHNIQLEAGSSGWKIKVFSHGIFAVLMATSLPVYLRNKNS